MLGRFTILLLLVSLALVPLKTQAQVLEVPPCEEIDPQYWPYIPECEHLIPHRQPLIVIPGLLASYNKKLLFKDQPGGQWGFIPLDTTYRGLLNKLELAGFEQGTNLFVGFYDWRQSNAESATEYLKPLIDYVKEETGSDKVDIVAHSMGGLVARSYIQSDLYEDDVDQLIMLGTPNAGASDAYVALEGGFFPDRWGIIVQWYVEKVERSLKKTRNQDLERPISFRAFFPSLQELLPINDYVKKANVLLPHTQLTAQNDFLTNLNSSSDLLEARGVQVATIAGTDKNTLDKIMLNATRTPEDTSLARWRDGHANPDPPPTNSTIGDETVLQASAHLAGEATDLQNVSHVELPEAAQDKVLELLGAEVPEPQHFHYEPPKAIAGWVVLSPLDVTITGPGGKKLSLAVNDFGDENAVYDDDPADPDDPKLIAIANPPAGEYKVELKGTGTGGYSVITTYADENEVRSSERVGTTTPGKVESFAVVVKTDGTFQAPSADVQTVLEQLHQTVQRLAREKKLTTKATSRLLPITTLLNTTGRLYGVAMVQKGSTHTSAQVLYRLLQREAAHFSQEVDRLLDQNAVGAVAAGELLPLRQALRDAGLL